MVKKYKKDDATSYALGATLTVELIKRRPEIVRAVYVSPRSDIAAVPAAARIIVPRLPLSDGLTSTI